MRQRRRNLFPQEIKADKDRKISKIQSRQTTQQPIPTPQTSPASLYTKNMQSPSSSSASLLPSSNNWEVSFGKLSSSFGFGATSVPSLPVKKSSKSSSKVHKMAPSHNQSSPSHSSPQKNWEATFGNLSSSYGFGGMAPSVPKKVSKHGSKVPESPPRLLSENTRPPQDYEKASGNLSSSYGFGPYASVLSVKR